MDKLKNEKVQWILKSKIGAIYLVASPEGLTEIVWKKHSAPLVNSLNLKTQAVSHLKNAVQQIGEYLDGKRNKFELALAPTTGTDFQKKVWRELQKIPYGQTVSYRDIAEKIKNEKAMRAVGSANGKNPLSIVVPCHRVIAANGSLGGYAGGLDVKSALLKIEQIETE